MSVLRGWGRRLSVVAMSGGAAWRRDARATCRARRGARRRGDQWRGDPPGAVRGALEMRPLLQLFLATEHRGEPMTPSARRGPASRRPRDETFRRIEECRAMVRELEPQVELPARRRHLRCRPRGRPRDRRTWRPHRSSVCVASDATTGPALALAPGSLSAPVRSRWASPDCSGCCAMTPSWDERRVTAGTPSMYARRRGSANDWGLRRQRRRRRGRRDGGRRGRLVARGDRLSPAGDARLVNVLAHAHGAAVGGTLTSKRSLVCWRAAGRLVLSGTIACTRAGPPRGFRSNVTLLGTFTPELHDRPLPDVDHGRHSGRLRRRTACAAGPHSRPDATAIGPRA